MEQVKGLVLYGSKYGSTRRYAQELARQLGFDCLDHRQATGQEAGQYPVIVYGGGLYAGGVTGLKQTCRRMEQPERAPTPASPVAAAVSRSCRRVGTGSGPL